jgi:hypothetical protein
MDYATKRLTDLSKLQADLQGALEALADWHAAGGPGPTVMTWHIGDKATAGERWAAEVKYSRWQAPAE